MYRGEQVILRAYEKTDLERAHQFFNDYEMMRFLRIGAIYPCSLEQEAEVIENLNKDKSKGYAFAIATLDGKYIGGCGYMDLDQKNATCMVGIVIGDKDYWGKGYGTDAMRVLLGFLFRELSLRKVQLGVFAYNVRGIKSYEKVGYKVEGVFKDQIQRDGIFHDEVRMAIFRDDFLKRDHPPIAT